jgi:hypothetical protein
MAGDTAHWCIAGSKVMSTTRAYVNMSSLSPAPGHSALGTTAARAGDSLHHRAACAGLALLRLAHRL